ncbi:hypothetical protein [Paenibacillus sp. GXUN7292]|uniref:hypothetical protein n=1 Tax=Paenibacillus sp. GXUN7292 TaxID=3422499 RepID=UPI003D7DA23B
MTQEAFHLSFNTHTVYVTLDDGIYKINRDDLSRESVQHLPEPSKEKPIIVLHKSQFDMAKSYLMSIDNPLRMDLESAELYRIIGFLNNEEYESYKVAVESHPFNGRTQLV